MALQRRDQRPASRPRSGSPGCARRRSRGSRRGTARPSARASERRGTSGSLAAGAARCYAGRCSGLAWRAWLAGWVSASSSATAPSSTTDDGHCRAALVLGYRPVTLGAHPSRRCSSRPLRRGESLAGGGDVRRVGVDPEVLAATTNRDDPGVAGGAERVDARGSARARLCGCRLSASAHRSGSVP